MGLPMVLANFLSQTGIEPSDFSTLASAAVFLPPEENP